MTDDLERLLEESVDAVERINSQGRLRCMCGCNVTFLDHVTYFRHAHPSAGRRGGDAA